MPAATKHIIIDPHRCTACWKCVDECPKKVIGKLDFLFHRHSHIDNPDACVGCKKCVKNCPNQAIHELTPETVNRAFRIHPGFGRRDWQKHVIDLMQ